MNCKCGVKHFDPSRINATLTVNVEPNKAGLSLIQRFQFISSTLCIQCWEGHHLYLGELVFDDDASWWSDWLVLIDWLIDWLVDIYIWGNMLSMMTLHGVLIDSFSIPFIVSIGSMRGFADSIAAWCTWSLSWIKTFVRAQINLSCNNLSCCINLSCKIGFALTDQPIL